MSTNQPRIKRVVAILLLPPALVVAIAFLAPLTTDPVRLFAGMSIGVRPGWLPGYGTIDPNMGYTAYALGVRAALDLLHGTLPLWNHFEGLGAPLLGEVQAAALFPPTLLLLLPHGQMIEQATLQFVAGLGTYLFLRRFGLGATAALIGGVLFELNGVFAWLRNAVYNPVAFLPWLFYIVETLFCSVHDRQLFAARLPTIALGALVGALSLYAGFPEVVYFYCLPLFLWVATRTLSLPARRAPAFLTDLLLVAALTLLLSAPLLIAFGHFLGAAEVGGHKGALFENAVLPAPALLQHLLPYVYGPIFARPQVAGLWAGTGGYLGLMPLLLALGAVVCGWRRPVCWVLALWVVVAVGASLGLPIVHAAFLHIPLVGIAAYSRYLDAGWIFACVVLAALFIDQLPSLSPRMRFTRGLIAATACLVITATAIVLAWPTLSLLWGAHNNQRAYIIVSFAAAAALLAAFGTGLARSRTILSTAVIAEALLTFLLPFASNPRIATIDHALIGFLQQNAGLQRVALGMSGGPAPNFGSAFGIATLNYDDLPVPTRTTAYVHDRLDPDASPVMFHPLGPPATPAARDRRRDTLNRHLDGYRAAGTRYLLADDDTFALPAYPLADAAPTPLSLPRDHALTLEFQHDDARPIQGVLVTVGTYQGISDGTLHAQLCQAGRCVEGATDLATATDNRPLTVLFPAPLTIAAGQRMRLSFEQRGGSHDVALWTWPGAGVSARPIEPQWAGRLPQLSLLDDSRSAIVLRTPTTTIFELSDVRPYASAEGCRVDAASHDRMIAQCQHPARLIRLEVFMPGWRARVNGTLADIVPVEDTFQGIDLPSGTSSISFEYAPTGLRASLPIALGALLACLAILAWAGFSRRRRGAWPPLQPREIL